MLFSACKPEDIGPDDVDLGYEYYPLKIGDYREYHVFRVNYLLTSRDTSEYYVREVVADTIVDFDETSYLMHRYYRDTPEDTWSLDSIWQAKQKPSSLIRTENNIRYVKLTFPIEEGDKWDGNASNGQFEAEDYTYVDVELPYSFDSLSFTNTLKVEQGGNFETLIDSDFRWEIYAANVGMVYRYGQQLEHQPSEDTTGYRLIQKLIDYNVQ